MEKRHPSSQLYQRLERSSPSFGAGVLRGEAVRYPWSRSSSKVRSRTSTPWSSPNRQRRADCSLSSRPPGACVRSRDAIEIFSFRAGSFFHRSSRAWRYKPHRS